MSSHAHHGFNVHWQVYCLFSSQYMKTQKRTIRFRTIASLWGETTWDQWNFLTNGQQREKCLSCNSSILGLHMLKKKKQILHNSENTCASRDFLSLATQQCTPENARKHLNSTLLFPYERNPPVTNGLALQQASDAKAFSGLQIYFCFINAMEETNFWQ